MDRIKPNKSEYRWDNVQFVTPFYGRLNLGNGTEFTVGIFKTADRLFVGIEGYGAYTFSGQSMPGYVNEKLRVPMGDAENISDFIRAQFGEMDFIGHYDEAFCD